jgi:LacI family transcriptional regulator
MPLRLLLEQLLQWMVDSRVSAEFREFCYAENIMKAKYYSTAELAEETGTSRQVISAIINEKWKEKRISQATYERIKKAMDDLGFVPDRTATSLKKDSRKKVGLLCHGPLYSHILTAIEKLNHHFLDQGIPVEMHISAEGGLAEGLRDLMGQRVESLIVLLSPMTRNFCEVDLKNPSILKLLRVVPSIIYNYPFGIHEESLEQELIRGGSQLIGFSKEKAYTQFFKGVANRKNTKILADDKIFSLFKAGTPMSRICEGFERLDTYPNPQSDKLGKNPFLIGEKLAHRLLPRIKEHRYDFILTSSDRIAQGMAAVLDESGLKIPQDINLLGFDKINSLPYFKHKLPTIEVPIQPMINELLATLKKQKWKGNAFRVEANLIGA